MSRLPRFKRASTVTSFHFTDRDRQIIQHVHRHRFLRSRDIVALVTGSRQQISRRLKLLYHHGYLERPHCQLDYFYQGGSHHMVYGLGSKAAHVLNELNSGRNARFGDRNSSVGRVYLDHALLVSGVMVGIELACRTADVRLLYEDELPIPAKIRAKSRPFHWKVRLNGAKLSVIPDRVFALETEDENGGRNRTYFFLEADRGTMPVVRRTLSQTSFWRKLIAYEATWRQDIHRSRFGFDRIRVLTVTAIAGRVNSLVQACSELKSGHGLFLFADTSVLLGNILEAHWQTGKPGQVGRLVE